MSKPLQVRTLVPIIAPTEFVRVEQGRAIEIAEWLAERGVTCEVRFTSNGPQLWRQGPLGPTPAEPDTWLGVQEGVFQGPYSHLQLASWREVDQ